MVARFIPQDDSDRFGARTGFGGSATGGTKKKKREQIIQPVGTPWWQNQAPPPQMPGPAQPVGRADVYSRDPNRAAAADDQATRQRAEAEMAEARARSQANQEMLEYERARAAAAGGGTTYSASDAEGAPIAPSSEQEASLAVLTGGNVVDSGPPGRDEIDALIAQGIRDRLGGPRDTSEEEALVAQLLQEQLEQKLADAGASAGARGLGASGAWQSIAGGLRRQAASEQARQRLGIQAGARGEADQRFEQALGAHLGQLGQAEREKRWELFGELLGQQTGGGGGGGGGDGGGGGGWDPTDPANPANRSLWEELARRPEDDPANWAHDAVAGYGGAYTPESLSQMGAHLAQENPDYDVWMLPDGRILQVGKTEAAGAVFGSGGRYAGGQ